MDDIVSLFNVRKNVLDMLSDRGYKVPEHLYCKDIYDFKILYNSKKCDIQIDNESKKAYIKFILLNRIRPNLLREYINQIRQKIYNNDIEPSIIIIIKQKPNTTLLKLDKEFKNVQIFWLKQLTINITKHYLNPKFTKLNDIEVNEVINNFNLKNKYQLPIMLSDDPISRYFGLKVGDICKVTRNSPTNGVYISYRCIK
jgi:DNA-directed RNA polymerase I, II, and III subunit RPABC1